VRDDDTEWTEMADQEVPSESDVPRRRGRKASNEPADAPVEAAETAEPRDGALEDTDDSGDAAASDPLVDKGALEAMLMSTHHPLTAGRLAEMLDLPSTKPIRQAIKALNADYETSGRSFRIEQVAGGFQILTLPTFGDYLKKL